MGFLPKSFIKIHEKTRIPTLALIASLVIGIIFLAPFPSWYLLVGFISSATVFTYIVGGPALRVFRKHAPDLKRPFKLPGSIIWAPLAFIGATLIVFWTGWPLNGYLAIAIFSGLLLFIVLKIAHAIPNTFDKKSIKAGWWVPVYVIVLTVMSYIGDSGLGGRNFIAFPYDDVAVIIVAIVFYIIAVYSGIKTDEIAEITNSGTQYLAEE
jgi:amino acid transporter